MRPAELAILVLPALQLARRRIVPAVLGLFLAGCCLLALPSCASGPQLVTTTPVISLAVTFDASDGGTLSGCMVMVNGVGQSAKPETHGNEVDADVDTSIETDVSAIPGG